jgi:hypothetical protein
MSYAQNFNVKRWPEPCQTVPCTLYPNLMETLMIQACTDLILVDLGDVNNLQVLYFTTVPGSVGCFLCLQYNR